MSKEELEALDGVAVRFHLIVSMCSFIPLNVSILGVLFN